MLGLFDLDGFKRYSDTYGHPAGDALLARLAERMAEAIGPGGRAYRMGGDEFCALLAGDAKKTAPVIARVAEALSEASRQGAIPDAILHKPGPLTQEEWRLVAQHSLVGERILSRASALTPGARLVRSTQEAFDGQGYPDGLTGEEIALGARVIAACDAFDAMTADRSYRRAMPIGDAVKELRRCAGSQFDPRVVEAFCAHLASGLLGGGRAEPTTPGVAKREAFAAR